jgi:hypothetical protein
MRGVLDLTSGQSGSVWPVHAKPGPVVRGPNAYDAVFENGRPVVVTYAEAEAYVMHQVAFGLRSPRQVRVCQFPISGDGGDGVVGEGSESGRAPWATQCGEDAVEGFVAATRPWGWAVCALALYIMGSTRAGDGLLVLCGRGTLWCFWRRLPTRGCLISSWPIRACVAGACQALSCSAWP